MTILRTISLTFLIYKGSGMRINHSFSLLQLRRKLHKAIMPVYAVATDSFAVRCFFPRFLYARFLYPLRAESSSFCACCISSMTFANTSAASCSSLAARSFFSLRSFDYMCHITNDIVERCFFLGLAFSPAL